MRWIELKDMEVGNETIFLIGCHPTQSAYKVKRWLQETKPNVLVLFADNYRRIKEYEAARWVRKYSDYSFHNYLTEGYQQKPVDRALKSLETAIQLIEQQYKFHPSEIVLVRAKKLLNT